MKEEIKDSYAAIGELFVTLLMGPITAIAGGFVLMKLWIWFLIPMGLFEISIVQAIGVKIIISFLTANNLNSIKIEQSKSKRVMIILIYDTVMLLFGFVYSRFL